MATYTPNLSLYMPDSTDDFGEFREEHNDNMVKIDNAIGGGGGSGGHTIIDPNGNSLPQESGLQFTGGVTVTDDSVNGKTVVDISGGGGNVYGAFIDTNCLLVSETTFRGSMSYTATEDCFVVFYIVPTLNDTTRIKIDGKDVSDWRRGTLITDTALIPVKKGQILSVTNANTSYDSSYFVYGLTQGTSGIFTPIIYSDTERVVGVWRDNKPLYQKTISVGTLPNNATKTTAHGISDIDTICSIDGIAYDGSGKTIPLGYINVDSYTYDVQVEVGKVNVEIKTKIDFTSYTGYITVQYTKTTDVAGSGNWNTDGVPTVHYSTSEQVIGTWENGKPLYRRIFTTNTMNISTSAGALYSGSVAIGDYIPDVDQIFVDIGKTYVNVSGVTRGLISASQEGSVIAVYSIVSRSNCTITFTVDYIKVTD